MPLAGVEGTATLVGVKGARPLGAPPHLNVKAHGFLRSTCVTKSVSKLAL